MATAATPRRLAALSAALAAVAVLAIGAPTAGARALSTSCSGATENPFLRWADPAAYTLAPGGDFEGRSSSWQLTNGAKVVRGNEPFKVHAPTDSRSLSIPAGGSATSPAQCVGLGHPTLRLFAVGGNLTSGLLVEAIYSTALGTVTQPVTLVPRMRAWGPTLPTVFLANVTGLASLEGLTSSVQFRFTATGNASWLIDDVYVDPWKVT